MKRVLLGILATATIGATAPSAVAAPLNDYTGRWSPTNQRAPLINLRIRNVNGRVMVRAIGRCGNQRCDWGRRQARVYGSGRWTDLNRNTRLLEVSFSERGRKHLVLMRAARQRMVVQVLTLSPNGQGNPLYRTFAMRKSVAGPANPPTVAERCRVFDPRFVVAGDFFGSWRIIYLGNTLYDFRNKQRDMRRTMRLIRRSGANSICWAVVPRPTFYYFRVRGQLPVGPMPREDCVPINPRQLSAVPVGNRWYVANAQRRFVSYTDRREARFMVAKARQLNAGFLCYIGRPNPSLIYFRR